MRYSFVEEFLRHCFISIPVMGVGMVLIFIAGWQMTWVNPMYYTKHSKSRRLAMVIIGQLLVAAAAYVLMRYATPAEIVEYCRVLWASPSVRAKIAVIDVALIGLSPVITTFALVRILRDPNYQR